jgi:glutamate--cysteine ligase
MVPHLITSLTGPINELEQRVLESMPAIERWFRLEWMEHTPPFYASVDLRNAGYKLAPVDTDLFPSGFNNLTEPMLPLAVQAAMAAIEKICPEARNLLLVPEAGNHSNAYLAHLQRLRRIFTQAGLNVRFGSLDASIKKPTAMALPDGSELVFEPLVRRPRRLELKDFDPCTILLNHDMRAGPPAVLRGIHEQYLLPPLHAGWAVRRKTHHFHAYEELAKRFGKLLGMDHWLINPMFERCSELDATREGGLDCVQTQVDSLLTKIKRKHKEYGIKDKPFVIVKSDNGTQGLGVFTVRDAAELKDAQRCGQLLKLAQTDGLNISQVIIQEGVPTYERMNDAVAEPVVLTVDRYVVGGYYRVHPGRGVDENLSSPGSQYVPLAFDPAGALPRLGDKPGVSAPNRFYLYGVIARLAMLAAAYELEATDPDAEALD